MLILPVILALVAAPARDAHPHAYMPCKPGLAVEYRYEHEPRAKMTDRVRGPGREANTCVIVRTTIRSDGSRDEEPWVREMLADRVTNAGWLAALTAFRPPLLVAPVANGTKWRFDRVRYVITSAGDTCDVPAGTFDDCVTVHERSDDGSHEAFSTYARGVGLVASRRSGKAMVAVVVSGRFDGDDARRSSRTSTRTSNAKTKKAVRDRALKP